jgi:hypothetical protein
MGYVGKDTALGSYKQATIQLGLHWVIHLLPYMYRMLSIKK